MNNDWHRYRRPGETHTNVATHAVRAVFVALSLSACVGVIVFGDRFGTQTRAMEVVKLPPVVIVGKRIHHDTELAQNGSVKNVSTRFEKFEKIVALKGNATSLGR